MAAVHTPRNEVMDLSNNLQFRPLNRTSLCIELWGLSRAQQETWMMQGSQGSQPLSTSLHEYLKLAASPCASLFFFLSRQTASVSLYVHSLVDRSLHTFFFSSFVLFPSFTLFIFRSSQPTHRARGPHSWTSPAYLRFIHRHSFDLSST